MWDLDHKESWAWKNWCFWTVVLEKTLESPLDCKIKPVTPKGNQSWIFIGRTDAEAEVLILWPPDAKRQLTGKDPDAEKDWGQQRMRWLDGIIDSMHKTKTCPREKTYFHSVLTPGVFLMLWGFWIPLLHLKPVWLWFNSALTLINN